MPVLQTASFTVVALLGPLLCYPNAARHGRPEAYSSGDGSSEIAIMSEDDILSDARDP